MSLTRLTIQEAASALQALRSLIASTNSSPNDRAFSDWLLYTLMISGAGNGGGGGVSIGIDYLEASGGDYPDMATQQLPLVDETNFPATALSITLAELYVDFFGGPNNFAVNPLNAPSGSGNPGFGFALIAGTGDGENNGGDINLTTGLPGTGGNSSGNVFIATNSLEGDAGSGQLILGTGDTSGGVSGELDIQTGACSGTGESGAVNISSGAVTGGTNESGTINVYSGSGANGTGQVNLYSGDCTSGNSGLAVLNSGTALSGNSGDTYAYTGDSPTFNSGTLFLQSGAAGAQSGDVLISSGNANTLTGAVHVVSGDSGSGSSGPIIIETGSADGTRGNLTLDAPQILAPSGVYLAAAQNPITLVINQQTADNGNGSDVTLQAGPGGLSTGNGGNIILNPGAAPSGSKGLVVVNNLPTSDPHVAGAWWIDTSAGRAVKSSAG